MTPDNSIQRVTQEKYQSVSGLFKELPDSAQRLSTVAFLITRHPDLLGIIPHQAEEIVWKIGNDLNTFPAETADFPRDAEGSIVWGDMSGDALYEQIEKVYTSTDLNEGTRLAVLTMLAWKNIWENVDNTVPEVAQKVVGSIHEVVGDSIQN